MKNTLIEKWKECGFLFVLLIIVASATCLYAGNTFAGSWDDLCDEEVAKCAAKCAKDHSAGADRARCIANCSVIGNGCKGYKTNFGTSGQGSKEIIPARSGCEENCDSQLTTCVSGCDYLDDPTEKKACKNGWRACRKRCQK